MRDKSLIEIANDSIQNAQNIFLPIDLIDFAWSIEVCDRRKHDRHIIVLLIVQLVFYLTTQIYFSLKYIIAVRIERV